MPRSKAPATLSSAYRYASIHGTRVVNFAADKGCIESHMPCSKRMRQNHFFLYGYWSSFFLFLLCSVFYFLILLGELSKLENVQRLLQFHVCIVFDWGHAPMEIVHIVVRKPPCGTPLAFEPGEDAIDALLWFLPCCNKQHRADQNMSPKDISGAWNPEPKSVSPTHQELGQGTPTKFCYSVWYLSRVMFLLRTF